MHRTAPLSLLLCLAGAAVPAAAQDAVAQRGSDRDASAQARVRGAFGGDAAAAVTRFDYRLVVTDAAGRVRRDARYALLPRTRALHVHDASADTRVWSGEDGSWRWSGGQWDVLGPALAQPYRDHVAYHFLPMLQDPATGYEAAPGDGDRVRVSPRGVAPFEVRLDPASGRVVENRFDGGTVVRELDYRDVGGVPWPMAFEVLGDGGVAQRGQFSDVVASTAADAALPPMPGAPLMPVGDAERVLPTTPDGAARLVGAGWLSGARNDYNLSVDARGERLVFARSGPDFDGAVILSARRDGAGWTAPEPVPFTDPRYSDSDPWLTPDGRTLYFVSNRPLRGDAPRADLDVWRVAVGDGGFGVPEHLPALSSPGVELGPELHGGWLYFNSTRGGGPAPLAIYRARVGAGGIGAPEPLGAPFNDGRQQGDFTLSPDGRTAVFWSQRDGIADGDLFAVRRDGDGWSRAVRLPSPLNAAGLDFTPSFSADGRTLRFASRRKPAWLAEAGHLFNGQANVFVAAVSTIDAALDAALGADAPR